MEAVSGRHPSKSSVPGSMLKSSVGIIILRYACARLLLLLEDNLSLFEPVEPVELPLACIRLCRQDNGRHLVLGKGDRLDGVAAVFQHFRCVNALHPDTLSTFRLLASHSNVVREEHPDALSLTNRLLMQYSVLEVRSERHQSKVLASQPRVPKKTQRAALANTACRVGRCNVPCEAMRHAVFLNPSAVTHFHPTEMLAIPPVWFG